MTLIWLAVWLIQNQPDVYAWNVWLITLLAAVIIDFGGASNT